MIALAWALVSLPVVLALYTYAVYPLLLLLVARRTRLHGALDESAAPQGPGAPLEPVVSVVIPAHNEEDQIRGALDALLAQDYPRERLQIIVVSDASTDGTDRIVEELGDRVELLRMPTRSGKTAGENAACARIRGDIVVNTDASIRLLPSTVSRLVHAMRDPRVGVASGRDVSTSPAGDTANATEARYVGYEMWVRGLETRAGGIVGASGSGYAIRAALHRIPVRADLSRDFSAALTAREHGLSAVSVDDAFCIVPRTSSLRVEYWRKVRTISRGVETLYHRRQLLDPLRHGLFAWKLFSHKVCRWVLPLAFLPGLFGVGLLATRHRHAALLLGLAVLGGALALAATLRLGARRTPRLLSLAAFAIAANAAVLHALWRFVHGHEDHIWEPTRRRAEPLAGQ